MSSSQRRQFKYLEIGLEKIESATNNFSNANFIKKTAFGKMYKGQHWDSQQPIVAERFDDLFGRSDVAFWNEISILAKLKHENLVSLVGFCYIDHYNVKIIITKLAVKGGLDKFLGDPTFTWMRRLQICVGVAHALSYIHYDKERNISVIHRHIKTSKVLLDDHWEPKLCGFKLSVTQTAAGRHRPCVTNFQGTLGYCDATYVQSGSVSHKSDMYSFGVVLFELLCGRKADDENGLLAPLVVSYYEGGRLNDLIDPGLRKQMDPESFKLFTETAYYCLKEQRPQRPHIDQILIKLKKALNCQWKHENPVDSMVQGKASNKHMLKEKRLEHLRILLTDIETATEKFAKKYIIGSGAYGDVYKGELDHFDSKNLLLVEEKDKGELPTKRSTVAIKRILIRDDKQGEEGFLAEIEMLTSCKHPNIISLLGFCDEGRDMILVYEHASNGSLDDYLGNDGNMTFLTWMQRIRICIDIARGLDYLHTKIEENRRIIHRDIKSGNILLDDNWKAKIADFGLSKLRPENQQLNTLYTQNIAGTEVYLDPEYNKTGKLKNETDIYSFGVVLFETLSGRFANDPIYTKENSNGIAAVARRRFNEGTIREMVDPRLMEETHENMSTINIGPNPNSLNAFSKIAYQCVAETQAKRPTAEFIIKKLEEALSFQENSKDSLKISLADIKLATQNFSHNNLIVEGGSESIYNNVLGDQARSGSVYKGKIHHANRPNTIAVKRLHRRVRNEQKGQLFLSELQILLEYKHENIISLVGYCNEKYEQIIVYEYACRGSLGMHLNDNGLTWMKRLEICIDIASGLDFLHGGMDRTVTQAVVMHRDIKSASILLNDNWKAKITDFGLATAINKDVDSVIDHVCGKEDYCDPSYMKCNFLTEKSDIYSFGVVLLEVLCGRFVTDVTRDDFYRSLKVLFKHHSKKGTLEKMVFKGIKEQIVPKSLSTFQMIVHQCLQEREKRPTAREVLLQLKKALEFQMENKTATIFKRVIYPPKNEVVPPVRHDLLVLLYNAKNQEKFNGMNFKSWQQKMHSDLITVNLATFLTEYRPELNADIGNTPPRNVIYDWEQSDVLCRNYILHGLETEIRNKYNMVTTAKKLWKSLDRAYNIEETDIVARFLEYKMVDSKTVIEQVQDFQKILHVIHTEGTTLSETFQVGAIIEKLPPAWVDFKNYLKNKKNEMSVDDLVMLLRTEEYNKLAKKKGYFRGVSNFVEHFESLRANK